jgi:nicotinamide-nucleotide amidase
VSSGPARVAGGGPGPARMAGGGPGPARVAGEGPGPARRHAERIIGLLRDSGRTVAVAESLTGGLLGAELTAVPGASAVFRGGIIAYATDLKAELLAVPAALLATHGAVDPGVALAMADGARTRLGASVGVATTGVAGPDSSEGKPPGTVHVAVSASGHRVTRALSLAGGREQIRRDTVEQCLSLLWAVLAEEDR